MRTVGIIAEYNPFHNGHRYQLQEVRRRLGNVPVITAMSGYFTQRGEPALVNKWARARWAVEGGVDLLLELPAAFALRSARASPPEESGCWLRPGPTPSPLEPRLTTCPCCNSSPASAATPPLLAR